MQNRTQLEDKIREISNLYKTVKKQDDEISQIQLLNKLSKLCEQTHKLLEASPPTAENTRRLKQLNDVQQKVSQLQIKNKEKGKNVPQKSLDKNFSSSKASMSRQQMSKYLARSIAMQQIRSTQLKVSPEQLQEIAKRMENNKDVMKQIQGMINDHGQNLDLIESNIMHAYENVTQANKQLDQAVDLSTRARLNKIRVGLGGILAAIGWGIIGIPGMILGMFAGWKITK